ncbi:hypothetical protein [Peribacillus sp. NPDC096540]|uniref:hypothetical protein n=1 Tax=Peribacillus sp. NPDC096540 TaxID=3390612 RepID=UPI003D07039B
MISLTLDTGERIVVNDLRLDFLRAFIGFFSGVKYYRYLPPINSPIPGTSKSVAATVLPSFVFSHIERIYLG